jgi:glucokinase
MIIRSYAEEAKLEGYDLFVLGGDIGGTHTNLAVAGVRDEQTAVLFSTHFESQKLGSLVPAIKETLEYADEKFGIGIEGGCAGVAGAVSGCRRSKPTNLSWEVDAGEIEKATGIKDFYIINDFQIIAYGIESLSEEDLLLAKAGSGGWGETRSIIGAGTGLGKAILAFDGKNYTPISSEGGHGDLTIHDRFDLGLSEEIRAGRGTPVSYEEVISGRGIERIYRYLKDRSTEGSSDLRYASEIEGAEEKAALISKYKEKDETSRETFKVFAKYYGRCAKNFVLDSMSTGGLYIAGGIAAKNREMFTSPQFQTEFLKANRQREILEKTPIYVILNYDVSLYGACNAAARGIPTCQK